MESARIILETKERGHFLLEDGSEGVSFAELNTHLEYSHQIARSLEQEFRTRDTSWNKTLSPKAQEFMQKLYRKMDGIVALRRLDTRATSLVPHLIKALEAGTTSSHHSSKVYHTFLCDLGNQSGRGFVLLCAVGLGKQTIVGMNNRQRCDILKHLKAHRDTFDHTLLTSIAAEYRVPENSGMTYTVFVLVEHN